MPALILILLVILTVTGYIRVPFTHISLFTIAGHTVTHQRCAGFFGGHVAD